MHTIFNLFTNTIQWTCLRDRRVFIACSSKSFLFMKNTFKRIYVCFLRRSSFLLFNMIDFPSKTNEKLCFKNKFPSYAPLHITFIFLQKPPLILMYASQFSVIFLKWKNNQRKLMARLPLVRGAELEKIIPEKSIM